MKKFITLPYLLLAIFLGLNLSGFSQQVIGSFSYMDGGFEGQTTGALGNTLSTTLWSRQSQTGATGSIVTTTPRSGSKYATVTNVATVSRGLQSPQTGTPANGPAANTQYVVQFFVKNASSVSAFQAGVTTNGTSNPVYSTAATLASNAGWTKQTYVITNSATAVTTAGITVIGRSTAGSFDIDDAVIYQAAAVDNTAPASPGTVTVNGATTTSLNVSWVAAGSVDGGGYVVVRYATSPNTDNDPNQNGIYAVNNTTTNGTGSLVGTVVYTGTGTSFSNTGLSPATTYYYKVYTVDKAFNYSAETSGSAATSVANPTTTSLSPSSITALGGNFTLTVNGTNFFSGSVVTWNGSNRTTTFVSTTQVTAAILSGDIASSGTASVGVTNAGAATPNSNTQTFTINGGVAQTITFNSLPGKTYGDASFNPGATASSGLAVYYTSSNTSVATVTGGNTINIVGAGTSTITAKQDGDGTYGAAADVPQTLTVDQKELTVTGAVAQDKLYDGTNAAIITGATLVGIVGSDNVTVSGGGTFAGTSPGTYAVTATLTLGGTDAGKYTLRQPTLSNATIIAPILAWDFLGKAGNETSVASTTTDANMSSSNVTRGAGISAAALPDGFSSTTYTVSGTLANAVTTNQYFQFTVNPKPGSQVALSSIDANLRRSATGPNAYQWKYSLDGFATAGINIGTPVSYTTSATTGTPQAQIDLSGISALQNVSTVNTVTFRMYPYGATNAGGTFAFGLPTTPVNDLAIAGTLSVAPIPDIDISSAHPAAGTADQGTSDVVIGIISLDVSSTNAYLLAATVTTAGTYTASDITDIKFWYNSVNSLAGATQLGTTQSAVGSGSTAGVSGLTTTFGPGHATYLIVTASIASSATVGHTISLATTSFSNLVFGSANKTGTNPIPASNSQTITQLDPTIAISTAHPAAGNVGQNTTNQIIGSIQLGVSVTSATLTGLSITTAGNYQTSDIQTNGFKFWINSTNNLTGATQLGSAQAAVGPFGTVSVTGLSNNIPVGTTRYLLVTADIAYNAVVGRVIQLGSTDFSNITFASANTTGTDPAPSGNNQTINAVTPSIAIASNGPTTATIGAPSTNNILYSFSTAITVNSTALTGVTLKFAGTYNRLEFVTGSIKVWYNSTNTFVGATQIGSGFSMANANSNLVITGLNQTVVLGNTGFFWVTGDLIGGVTPGHGINATAPALANFTFSQGTKTGTPAATGTQSFLPQPTITEVIIPQYMHGTANKVPYVYRVKIGNLSPNATYRYNNTVIVSTDASNSNGVGTMIFSSTSGVFTQSSTQSLSTAGAYSSFTTDASGNYTGWFISESSSNTRFTTGNIVYMRILLNDGAGGTTVASRVTTTSSALVVTFATSAGANNATGIRGSSSGTAKDIVLLYDNVYGTGRPLSAAYIESDGYANSASYPGYYTSSVDGVAGAWGSIIPNTLTNGLRRIEQRSLATGSIVNCPSVTVNGVWPSGTNTVNPTGGSTTALVITSSDAPLNSTANTWLGVNSNWQNAANWVCGIPNSSSTDVIIPANSLVMPSLSYSSTAIRNLSLLGTSSLNLNNKALTITGTITGATANLKGSALSDLTISGAGGTLYFASGFRELRNLTLNSGATVTLGTPLDITSANFGGNLVVNAGATLNTGGNLTIKSSVTGTASIGNSAGTINGNVTVERYIHQNAFRAWRMLSVPTTGQTIHASWQENQAAMANGNPGYGSLITSNSASALANGFDAQTSGNSMLVYNSLTSSWGSVPNTSSAIATTSGYMLYVRGSRSASIQPGQNNPGATILRTTGTIFQGTQTAITVPSGQNVLIGNRYASAIDFTNLIRSGVNDFKVWDPKLAGSSNVGGFQTFSSGDGYDPHPGGGSYAGLLSNSRIESGQAFFVSSSSGSVQLVEAAKVTGSRNVFRNPDVIRHRLKSSLLAYTTGGLSLADGNSVSFDSAYANIVDNDDATKISNFGENFGINVHDTILAVNARQPIATYDTVYYKTWNLKKIQYQLQFVALNVDEPGLSMMLIDKFTGTSTQLNNVDTTKIDFFVTNDTLSSVTNRFKVVFKISTVMPVTFTTIHAKENNRKVNVDWKVAAEQNIHHYEVEHSVNGRSFETIGTVNALGNALANEYKFTDQQPASGDNYYRVKSVDVSDKALYSAVVKINLDKQNNQFVISPNPVVDNRFNLQFNNQPKGQYAVRLINTSGQVLLSKTIDHEGENSVKTISLPSGITAGVYQLEITQPGSAGKLIQKLIIGNN